MTSFTRSCVAAAAVIALGVVGGNGLGVLKNARNKGVNGILAHVVPRDDHRAHRHLAFIRLISRLAENDGRQKL